MKRGRFQTRGFTLLELLLVMLLILLMAALVAPSLQNFSASRDLDNDASTLVSLANYARTEAQTQGKTYRLNFDDKNGKFWLTYQDELASPFVAVMTDEGKQIQLPDGVKMTTQLGVTAVGVSAANPSISSVASVSSGQTTQAPLIGLGRAGSGQTAAAATGWVDFNSDGRVDPATITLTDAKGRKLIIACQTPTETFQLMQANGLPVTAGVGQ